MITDIERERLCRFFNDGGYVLDFTNEKFDDFTAKYVGKRIRECYGLSKGKSLERFIQSSDESTLKKLLVPLLDYAEQLWLPNFRRSTLDFEDVKERESELSNFRVICNKLSDGGIAVISSDDVFTDVPSAVAIAEKRIELGDYDGALTKAKSIIEYVCKNALCDDSSGVARNDTLSACFSRFRKKFKMDVGKNVDKPICELVGGLIKTVEAIGHLRNIAGDAHGGIRRYTLKEHHARLAVNAATTVANFLMEVAKRQASN